MAGRAPELSAEAVWGKHQREDGGDEAAQAISLWPYYASAGGLVLIALFIGQRWDWLSIARVLLVAALVVLAVALFRVRTVGTVAWLTLIIPGLVLLLTIPFFGPMPRAGEEAVGARP